MNQKYIDRIKAGEERLRLATEKANRARAIAQASTLRAQKAKRALEETSRKRRDSAKFILGSAYMSLLVKAGSVEAHLKEKYPNMLERDMSFVLEVIKEEKERIKTKDGETAQQPPQQVNDQPQE